MKNKIVVRAVAISRDFDALIEDTRKKLGMNRSAFYKYAVTKLLQELSVLTRSVHEDEVDR